MSEIEFGPAIHVNGVKPEWLKNDEWRDIVVILNWDEIQEADDDTIEGLDNWGWSCITSIRLPSSHAVYSVIAHNAKYGTNFTYWPGGVDSNAPSDWDGKTVLYRDGSKDWDAVDWSKHQGYDDPQCSDIIGYTKRVYEETVTDDQTKEWEPQAGDWVRAIAPCPEIYGGPSNYDVGFETRIIADDNDGLCIIDEQECERLWSIHGDNFIHIEGPTKNPNVHLIAQTLAEQVMEALAERDMLRHQVRELRAQLAKVKEILG